MKNKIKLKYSNIFIFIVIVYILVQVLVYVIGYFTRCEILKKEEIDLSFTTDALVIMDEELIKADEDGKIEYFVSDYEKISKDKHICSINTSNEEIYLSEINKLKKEINDLKTKDNKINENIIKNKEEQLNILENKRKNNYIEYNSNISGISLFSYDNYCEQVTLDKAFDIDFDKIENSFFNIDNENKVKKDDVILRIINPNSVYIYFYDSKNILEKGSYVDVKLKNNIIKGKVENIYKKNNKSMILLKIIEQNKEIYITRIARFGIIYKKIHGFKIPITSVKEKNGKSGVYVVDEETQMPKFTELNKIYYKDENYLYVDYNKSKDNKKNLKLYDKILLYPNIINQNIKVSR